MLTPFFQLPVLLLWQEVRLGSAMLAVLDLENCTHLRELQLSEAAVAPLPPSHDAGTSGREEGNQGSIKVSDPHSLPIADCSSVVLCGATAIIPLLAGG